VAGVDTNSRSAAIVRSIVALCHGLGLQVVAEGVERSAQLDFLAGCGPIGVQGYLLAHPVEAASAASEAQAASARARLSLEAGSRVPRHEGVEFVQGSITADHVIINGTVRGPGHARELLELQPKARIEGDVHYRALEMHQGAVISGTLKPLDPVAGEKPLLKLAANNH